MVRIYDDKIREVVVNGKCQCPSGNQGKEILPEAHANGNPVQWSIKVFYHGEKKYLCYF